MRRRLSLTVYLLGLLLNLPPLARAQTDTAGTPFLQRIEHQREAIDQMKTTATPNSTFARDFTRTSEANMLADNKAMLAEYQYRKATWEYYTSDLIYRSKVFNWQYDSARLTFAVAVLIMLCGLFFSGIQFRIAMKQATLRLEQHRLINATAVAQGETPSELATSLKLSAQGVEVSSSILGLIIMILSLAFFYLYLVYVFPIKETNFDASGRRTEQQAIVSSPASVSQ